MSKKGDGIRMSIGRGGYSIGSAGCSLGYSLAGSPGYSLAGSGKGYGLAGRLNSSSINGYLSMAAGGYSAGMKTKGYSLKQPYPVSLLPATCRKIPDPLDEMLRMYRKKCPKCGQESMGSACGYSLN